MSITNATPEPGLAEPAAPAPATPRRAREILRAPVFEGAITFVVFLVIFGAFGLWLGSGFLDVDARLLDVHQDVPILLLGLAVLVTLVAGMFDLSVASMATLTTFLSIGLVAKDGLPIGLVLVICVAVGALGGLLNGLLVEKLGINAFIATLGTGGLFAGAAKVYSGGAQITPGGAGQHTLPNWFSTAGTFADKLPTPVTVIALALALAGAFWASDGVRPKGWTARTWTGVRLAGAAVVIVLGFLVLDLSSWISGTSWLIGVLLVLAALLWVLLRFTTYGRYLRAAGANRSAARLAGVAVEKEVVKAFVAGGVLSALAGVTLAATQGTAAPDVAATFLLPAFAAAFLSTVIFSTGQFTVWGTLIGGTFVVWVNQGLIAGGLPPTWSDVVNGVVLVGAVALSSVVRRQRA